MSYVSTEEAKEQLAIEAENVDHDARIARLISAAESWAVHFLNASLDSFEDSPATSPATIPEDLKSGILFHVEAHFDRDERSLELLLRRAEQLLWPYRAGLEV